VKLSLRFFIALVALIALAGWLFFREYSAELVPGMRQSLEEALLDTANLLAEQVQTEMASGDLATTPFAEAFRRFNQRRFNAGIGALQRHSPNLFVYVTDARGIVLYDSRGIEPGSDYSRWNDVYKTLRGEYGARTSRDDANDPNSSIMYVAAPIRDGDQIIGVLTVAKPSMSVQPYIEQMRGNMLVKGLLLVLIAIPLAALLSFGLTRSIARLTRYVREVRDGKRVTAPSLQEPELKQLVEAMESMRSALEGKDYVENYLHTLTHELKSPMAAIHGASEILQDDPPAEQRGRFVNNIANEVKRMQQVVERLLGLAALERRQGLIDETPVDMAELISEITASRMALLQARDLKLEIQANPPARVAGEHFLLSQAIANLLDNAIDFSPDGATIEVEARLENGGWELTIRDHGPGIPEYALPRLFERFYSLPRPGSGRKSSGLGLAFVREAAELHGGSIHLDNAPQGGTLARLRLPRLP
jgi:two-component system sensor histidine kinase CreC